MIDMEMLRVMLERPGVKAEIADLFEPISMITPTHGYTTCRACGAAVILATSVMNWNTAQHYLHHHPEARP